MQSLQATEEKLRLAQLEADSRRLAAIVSIIILGEC